MSIDRQKVIDNAQNFAAKGQWDKAIAEYMRVVKEDPKDARVLLKVGELQIKKGAKEDAIATYSRVAKIYDEEGFVSKAIAVYKQILSIDPNLAELYNKLADLYVKQGLIPDALAHLDALAQRYARLDQNNLLLGVFKQMVQVDPKNVPCRIKLAELYSKLARLDEAAEEFASGARLLKEAGRLDDWSKVAERLLYHRPADEDLARELARYYLSRRDARNALPKLQVCFKANPKHVETLELLSDAFRELGQLSKTISVLKEVARIHHDNGRPAERVEVMKKVLELAPGDIEAREVVHGPPKPVAERASSPPGERKPRAPTGAAMTGSGSMAMAATMAVAPGARPPGPPPRPSSPSIRAVRPSAVTVEPDEVLPDEAPPARPAPSAKMPAPPPPPPGVKQQPTSVPKPPPPAATTSAPKLPAPPPPASSSQRTKLPQPPPPAEASVRMPMPQPPPPVATAKPAAPPVPVPPPAAPSARAAPARAPMPAPVVEPEPPPPPPPEPPPAAAPPGAMTVDGVLVVLEPPGEEAVAEAARMVGEADVFLKYGLRPKAIGHLERAADIDPTSIDVHVRLRDLYAEEGDAAQTVRHSLVLAQIVGPGDPATALAEVEHALQILPDEPAAIDLYNALYAMVQGVPPEGAAAADDGNEATSQRQVPAPAAAYSAADVEEGLDEAEFMVSQGLYDDALETLRGLLEQHPNHPLVLERWNEVAALVEAGGAPAEDQSFALAEKLAEEVDAQGDGGGGQFSSGNQMIDVESVFSQFKKGVEKAVSPDDADTHYDLGIAYREMGLSDDAVSEFAIAANSPKKACAAFTMIGLCYMEKGEVALAIENFGAALSAPNRTALEEAGLYYELGAAYESVEQYADALAFFQRVEEFDPTFRDVTDRVARLVQYLGATGQGDEVDNAFENMVKR